MTRITGLKPGRSRSKRVNISLDGRPALSIEAEVYAQQMPRVGQELSQDQIEALKRQDEWQRCYNAASRYLAYRPRSASELRQRLLKRGFGTETIGAVVAELAEKGLLDDAAFARFWKENRDTFSPRSRWLVRAELRQKGIAAAVIEQVTGQADDSQSAYRAAQKKAGRLPLGDYPVFRRRLGDFLKRRGYGYGVVQETVARLWRELGGTEEQLP
ncbi:MAG: RecX family transcriptional regulator [Dehalococcoidales bacterium]